ncbi:hypothetical protein ABFS82_04G020400 [Erythranthe guttata]|uniref:Pectinesterase inhibitor domain-containing protein n=1 Tax=Erythranthe guttata TaxID=4155 RepID=A0A022S5J5_ERYGU|nr:PREDICTED: 21 kDa protein-like [Erythranthe guttata]EYU46665.1 hypothetical protein MIMGU_mgv1a014078mg [Erythranthe guttata]|eukprot:XP_012837346.1 PREDICTED: 21 kDa protein-like [Erythranthe guttata]
MTKAKFVIVPMLLACLIFSCSSTSQDENESGYVRDACSVTRYRDLCVHSLAPFSNTAKRNPIRWARAGVSVTIAESKRVAHYMAVISKNNKRANQTRRRNGIALSDCVECFQDTLDNLHKSLFVLRELSVGEFDSQVEDVTTWVSAALTDEDTCLDGFDEQRGKRVRYIVNRVSNVTCMTSNALALINKLATTGPDCLVND